MACLTFRRGLIGVSPSDRRFCKLDNLQRTDVRQSKPPLASPQMSFGVRLSRIHFSPTEEEKWGRNECDKRTPKDVCREATFLTDSKRSSILPRAGTFG